MKNILFLFLMLLSFLLNAQNDSTSKHGTIKIGKKPDIISFETSLKFNVYSNSNSQNINTIKQFEKLEFTQKPSDSTNSIQPLPLNDNNFDFKTFFSQSSVLNDDFFFSLETDTIKIKITVLKDGTYKYKDLETGTEVTKKGIKTKNEFRSYKSQTINFQIISALAQIDNWSVAKILEPKRTHLLIIGAKAIGFRNRNKLVFYPANSSGILTIIVSKKLPNE